MKIGKVTLSDILTKYNIIGLAIGVAVGVAGKDLIFSIANDVVMPAIGLVFKNKHFKNMKFNINNLVSSIITFFVVMFVIILLIYTVLRRFVADQIISDKSNEENIQKDLGRIINNQHSLNQEIRGSSASS